MNRRKRVPGNVPAFDEFWQSYPLHRGRKEAERAWNRMTAGDKRLALAALPAYAADCQKHGRAYKYAQGWINGRRWEDNLEEEVIAQQTAESAGPMYSALPEPACDACGNRIGDGISESERAAFRSLKSELMRVWSRNRNAQAGAALKELLEGLELYGVNDGKKMIYIHSGRLTFNREYAVPFFWAPEDFDALVSGYFNGYKWASY